MDISWALCYVIMEKFFHRAGEIVGEALYNLYIAKFKKMGYTEYESQVEALREIAKNYDIDWNEVDSDG